MAITSDKFVYMLALKYKNPSFQVFKLLLGLYKITETNKSLHSSMTLNNNEIMCRKKIKGTI